MLLKVYAYIYPYMYMCVRLYILTYICTFVSECVFVMHISVHLSFGVPGDLWKVSIGCAWQAKEEKDNGSTQKVVPDGKTCQSNGAWFQSCQGERAGQGPMWRSYP